MDMHIYIKVSGNVLVYFFNWKWHISSLSITAGIATGWQRINHITFFISRQLATSFSSKLPEPAVAKATTVPLLHLFFSGVDDLPVPAAL